MTKVLILANSSGGLVNFRLELITRLIKEEYRVYFGVPQEKEDEYVKKLEVVGANYIRTWMNRRGMNPVEDLKLIRKYRELVKEVEPDVILTYTIKPNIYGNYVASIYNIPTITNITGLGTSLETGRLKYVIKKMYKYACNRASEVFFQNEANRHFFLSNNLVKEEKTRLLPGSGVNINKYVPMNKESNKNGIKFLYIGRLMRDIGIEEYLRAAKNIVSSHLNVEFQVLGSYEEKKYIDKISESKSVKYLGVSEDVRNEIREIDCIVHPSYHEGMSNVLLEGAAMAKPLVASNIPGCREVIDEGMNGFLFRPKSSESLEKALLKFINSEVSERNEMGKNSRKKVVKEFDREIVINKYLESIKRLSRK